jgi:hypothetical protein
VKARRYSIGVQTVGGTKFTKFVVMGVGQRCSLLGLFVPLRSTHAGNGSVQVRVHEAPMDSEQW